MSDQCESLSELLDREDPGLGKESGASLRSHLESCPHCRRQAAADAALRSAFSRLPRPDAVLSDSSERLDHRLTAELEARARAAPRLAAGSRPRIGAHWALAAYATVGLGISVWVLSSLSWPAVPALVPLACLGVVALLTPLVLFDPIGVLRPPVGR